MVVFHPQFKPWIHLTLFSTQSILSAIAWITFSPVIKILNESFDNSLTLLQINLLSLIYLFIYPFTVPVASYVLDNIGLRSAMIIACILQAIGFGVRYFVRQYWIGLFFGQIIIALAQGFVLDSPPKVASEWFSIENQGLATSIGVTANPLGIGLGLLIIPLSVVDTDSLAGFLLATFLIQLACSILILLFFQASPHSSTYTPISGDDDTIPLKPTQLEDMYLPSVNAQQSLHLLLGSVIRLTPQYFQKFTTGIEDPRVLFQHSENSPSQELVDNLGDFSDFSFSLDSRPRRAYWMLCFVFSVVVGTVTGFTSIIPQIYGPFGVSEKFCGIVGSLMLVAGILAGLLMGVFLKKVTETKQLYKVFGLCSLVSCISLWILVFLLSGQKTDLDSHPEQLKAHSTYGSFSSFEILVLIVSSLCWGFASFAILPLGFHLSSTVPWPVGEGTGSGIFMSTAQILAIFSTVFFIILSENRVPNFKTYDHVLSTSSLVLTLTNAVLLSISSLVMFKIPVVNGKQEILNSIG